MFRRKWTAATLAVTAGLASVALSSPAQAEEVKPDLKTAVAFSQETGKVGDTVTITVTVTNVGTVPAKNVRVIRELDDDLSWTTPAIADGPKFDLAPAESKVLTRTGVIPQKAYADGYIQTLYYFAAENGDKNVNDNIASRRIRVPGQLGDYTVSVVDATSNTGVAGAVVEFAESSASPGNLSARVTTGDTGNAVLTGAPAGTYQLKVTPPAGWKAVTPVLAQVNIGVKPGTWKVELQRNGEPTAGPSGSASPRPGNSVTPSATSSPSASGTPTPASSSETPGGSGGGLPITGSNGTLIVGAGLVLLVAGAVAFLLARQRRTRFTSAG